MNLNIKKIKLDFPILKKKINGNKIIYLDNATSTQKPKIVIKTIENLYKNNYSSTHRGIYTLSNIITNKVEKTRIKISKLINANSPEEIIFVKNSTEGLNLIINTWGKKNLSKKDNIIISLMEHHANIIPWYLLANEIKYEIKIIKISKKGSLDINHLEYLINKNTKIISLVHISNTLGNINPIKKIINIAKKYNILTIIDGSQAIAHKKINVQKLNCDFYIFSGHKMYGPTGTGIIYNKKNLLKKLLPWQGGGGIIANINIKNYIINSIKYINSPWKFEAGTQNIESIIGLNSAINYINNIGLNNIKKYENKILKFTLNKLKSIPNIKIYGHKKKISIIPFNIKNYHCYDIGTLLDQYGISIRTGHQCTIPIMKFYNVSGMCRISIAIYNSKKDINTLIYSLKQISKLLK